MERALSSPAAAPLPGRLRSGLGLLKLLLRFARGYAVFCATGRTPAYGYASMRQLYCRTNGRLNDAMARLARLVRPGYALPQPRGVLGHLDPAAVRQVAAEIRELGFHTFAQKLPPDACASLLEFATTAPCRPCPGPPGGPATVRYQRDGWIATKYAFDEERLLELPLVQRLISDPSILAVAQAYLGTRPVQDMVSMWWSTALTQEASSEAAQLYHFDMDRLKFVKFFIYLTDVGPANGPHCYVARSVRRKPRVLLRDGRILDGELEQHYVPEDFRELGGERGTMLAVDTRGFHKGKPLESGDRLILQIEFSDSLFGQTYAPIHLCRETDAQLASAMRSFPYTYSRFR